MMRKFLQNRGHKFVAGMTQSGKTYFSKKFAGAWSGPCFFWNPQGEEIGDFILCDWSVSIKDILRFLRQGGKINYICQYEQEFAVKELEYLIERIKGKIFSNLLFVVDEVQDFAVQGKDSPLFYIARRGLRWGITGMFIAQSPADVSKVLVKQAVEHYIFKINSYDKKYYLSYGIPGDEVEAKIRKGGMYSFCIFRGSELEGPYKI